MERLTIRTQDGAILFKNAIKIAEAFDRLAAYEDIGLTPEEIEHTLENFSALLCYVTNNRMSKTNYTLEDMKREVDNCWQEEYDKLEDRKFADLVLANTYPRMIDELPEGENNE